jgi:hypothetical protein
MPEDDYSHVKVIKNKWPEWISVQNGCFTRHWVFEFEAPLDVDRISSKGLSETHLAVDATVGASPTELKLTTTTNQNPRSDEIFYFAFYRLFRRLEMELGKLKSIQGQPRDEWRPFR